MMKLTELYRIDEMARGREDAMWAVLDWAATQTGEFTIKDMHREWVKAGGGGDSASYQQFSTAINNYIYKFDPQSPVAKYRNPRYKYIRVGKTDKGTVPAPLQFVTRGSRGAGAKHVLRWRPGIAPMRQPSAPKAPLAAEGDPVGDVLDRLEKKLGRPALKAAMQRWKQLGDLHKISADIMADVQIKGRDKMLALQVAADSLVSKGKATKADAVDAEDEMKADVGGAHQGGLFKAHEPEETGFEDDEDQKTDPDAKPFGAEQEPEADAESPGQSEPEWDEDGETDKAFDGEDDEAPDDLLHGGEDGGGEQPAADSDEVAPVGADSEPEGAPAEDDGTMRGTLVNDEGKRIPVTIEYDEDEGCTVTSGSGEAIGPYEGFNLEVANGVLTQDAFDDLEEDGWSLVAAEEAQADDSEEDAEGEDDDAPDDSDDGGDEEEPDDRQGSIQARGEEGNAETGDFPSYVPEPDEEGDKYSRAMFWLVAEGHELEPQRCGEEDPLWPALKGAKDAVDAHRIIKASGLPHGLHKYALIVARAIFTNTGRDFDAEPDAKKRNESRLAALYGIIESPLQEPVDFEQTSGLKRVFGWAGRNR